MTIDLDAIRERSDRYCGLADRLVDGCLPDMSPDTTAAAIGFSATLTAADVPDLLAEVDRLRTALADEQAAHAKTVSNFEEYAEIKREEIAVWRERRDDLLRIVETLENDLAAANTETED